MIGQFGEIPLFERLDKIRPDAGLGGDLIDRQAFRLANLPKKFTQMVRSALAFDFAGAKKLNDELLEAYHLLFAENNPAGVKAFLAELGLIENYLRLPMVPLSDALKQKVVAYLRG